MVSVSVSRFARRRSICAIWSSASSRPPRCIRTIMPAAGGSCAISLANASRPRGPKRSLHRGATSPRRLSAAWIRFFSRVRCAEIAIRPRVSSRRSRNGASGIHTVGNVPLRLRTFRPCTSSSSVLLTIAIITFAFLGCVSLGVRPACSISFTIQDQLTSPIAGNGPTWKSAPVFDRFVPQHLSTLTSPSRTATYINYRDCTFSNQV